MPSHKSGFVSIIGKPNTGKSTLVNALTGETISIVTHKAQTTRHRIRCIANGENFQVVFSDTPGIIEPAYLLQEKMMDFVKASLEDADLLLVMIEAKEKIPDEKFLSSITAVNKPVFLVINKIDLCEQGELEKAAENWTNIFKPEKTFLVSALHKFGLDDLMKAIVERIPESPEYFPKTQLTDLSERFFVSEIIREKILKYYKQEIPYCVQVVTEEFKEEEKIIKISTIIYAERESQKAILIGPKGAALKQVGIQARKSLELSLKKQVFLQMLVKVKANWRNTESELRRFGYGE
jgi:GTP-binding protein Era